MPFRKASPETHQMCRSLLQKAVRRGCLPLINKVVDHLVEVGDLPWLKNRTRVITFEECWPFGAQLEAKLQISDIIRILSKVALSRKNKDAAGLGSLAFEMFKGDNSIISDPIADRLIQIIADAIKKPEEYWSWISKEALKNENISTFIEIAHNSYKHGGWPWDRAFMQAAALLAVMDGIPNVIINKNNECSEKDFPYWVAIDKHTKEGKYAIQVVAKKNNLNPRKISWLFFYFASSIENDIGPSYWWKREMEWRLNIMGYTLNQAKKQWDAILQDLCFVLSEYEQDLKEHIFSPTQDQNTLQQLPLFNFEGKE